MDKTRLTVEIDKGLKAEAKAQAYFERKTLKGKIVELLCNWLHGLKKEGGSK